MLNEDIINSCLYFNAMGHPSSCWIWKLHHTNFSISYLILLQSGMAINRLIRVMDLVQQKLVTSNQEVTPRIPSDFLLSLQTTDEGTRTLSFSLNKHFSLDNFVEDKEFLGIPLDQILRRNIASQTQSWLQMSLSILLMIGGREWGGMVWK